ASPGRSIFTYIVLGLNVLGWILSLAGVAALQSKGANGSFTGFIWWGVWFQFFVLAFIIASLFINMSSYSQAIFTFLGMVTVVLMVSADQSRSAVDAFSGSLKSSAQATLAGTIFNIIMNFILILSLTGELDTLTSHITHNHTPRPGAEPVTGGSATMTTNPIAAESATV
ncbi:hypothetical protein H632_c2125p0, partial [Helicosporidium sp. ATCC 50920]